MYRVASYIDSDINNEMNVRYGVSIPIVNLMESEVMLHPKLQPHAPLVRVDLKLPPKARKTTKQ